MRNYRKKILYVAYIASSIDGRIAKHSLDNLSWTSTEDWQFLQNSLKKFDAVIVGHNTYRVAKKNLDKRNAIVLTNKKLKSFGSVKFLKPEKHSIKRYLMNNQYKRVAILGGPRVYDFCLKNKMFDEIFVTIEPYIFTNGIPMFTGEKFKRYNFLLKSIKKLNKKGTLLLHYICKYK